MNKWENNNSEVSDVRADRGGKRRAGLKVFGIALLVFAAACAPQPVQNAIATATQTLYPTQIPAPTATVVKLEPVPTEVPTSQKLETTSTPTPENGVDKATMDALADFATKAFIDISGITFSQTDGTIEGTVKGKVIFTMTPDELVKYNEFKESLDGVLYFPGSWNSYYLIDHIKTENLAQSRLVPGNDWVHSPTPQIEDYINELTHPGALVIRALTNPPSNLGGTGSASLLKDNNNGSFVWGRELTHMGRTFYLWADKNNIVSFVEIK